MVDFSVFPKNIDINLAELKSLAIRAGFSEDKVNKNEKKLQEYLELIISKKSLFKMCKEKHIYFKRTKKCIPFEAVTFEVKQNLDQLPDGRIVKKEGGGNVVISTFPMGGGQMFFLYSLAEKKAYERAITSILFGGSHSKVPEQIFSKVETALKMKVLCVNLLETIPIEVTDKEVIRSLSINVSFNEDKIKEYQIGENDNIIYSRDLNAFFMIDEADNSDFTAISDFIKLGGKLGERKCRKGKPCDEKEFCELKTAEEGRCVQDQFEEKGLDEEIIDGSVFRGTPEVINEFRRLIGKPTGAAMGATVVGKPPELKEEKGEDEDRLREAIRTCLEGGEINE
jgi:hypothetical protein